MVKSYKGICKQCNKDKWIQNSREICSDCVYMNNNGGKTRFEVAREKESVKPRKVYRIKRTPLKRKKTSLKRSPVRSTQRTRERRAETLRKDRELYLYIFNTKPNECEECGAMLPDVFESEGGNIIYINQFSHILSKGSSPELRHNKLNINRLCLTHHDMWEFGDKENMKIYKGNQVLIEKMRGNG